MINNIQEFLKKLDELGEPSKGYTRFFRGHSDKMWVLEPGIYRTNKKGFSYIANEENIIKDAIINSPSEFSDREGLFNVLVKLQHYGYPTRLLDLTTNALVALYFAVCDEKNLDGEIIILDIPNEYIKYFDSDTVSILSAISLRPINFNIQGYKQFARAISLSKKVESVCFFLEEEHKKTLKEHNNFFRNSLVYGKEVNLRESRINDLEKHISECISKNVLNDLDKALLEDVQLKNYISSFNQQPEISKLLHDIRSDKPSFMPIIEPDDLERVICVKPKLNNGRILRQQGCFLLFGIDGNKANFSKVNSKWIRKLNGLGFVIPHKFKSNILRELNTFGVSKKMLFPELESQRDDILSYYESD